MTRAASRDDGLPSSGLSAGPSDFTGRRVLGRTGRRVGRIGLGSSFGIRAADVEHAYHRHGLNYLYWGSIRRPGFGRGIRNLARSHRDDLIVVLQSYARSAALIKVGVRIGLKRLRLEYADVLLLGLYNRRPPQRFIDAAIDLRERGLVRFLAISCHHRPSFQDYLGEGLFDIVHVRYNAAHRGAETEVFPFVPGSEAPGVVSFTATRWGTLLNPRSAPPGDSVPEASDCYRFALSHPTVDLVLSGPANRRELDEACRALERGPMGEDELAWMRRVGDRVHG